MTGGAGGHKPNPGDRKLQPDRAPAGAGEARAFCRGAYIVVGGGCPACPARHPMTTTKTPARDWSATLFLPKTQFPMKAGLPQLEPKLLERWAKLGLYHRLRAAAKGRPKFILHDGPPYANANIHLGTALNKILKDIVTRSQQMLGFDSNYVPGSDCHGLPIEMHVEKKLG